jgi:hypothetical protein
MDKDYRPRLSVEITEEQARQLRDLIPWGSRKQLFSIIVEDVIRLLREHGTTYIAAVLARQLKLEDYISLEVKNAD